MQNCAHDKWRTVINDYGRTVYCTVCGQRLESKSFEQSEQDRLEECYQSDDGNGYWCVDEEWDEVN
jgi:hypothetical protein